MNFPKFIQNGRPVIDWESQQEMVVCWSLTEAPERYLDHPLQTVAHDAEMERWPVKVRKLVESKKPGSL